MRLIRSILLALSALTFATSARAHDQGPPVGAPIPAIEAQDQTGAARDLASLTGPNGLVLVFTRSADWCPYCQRQMIGLEGVRAEIEARGWRIAAVTTDDVAKLARFTRVRHIGYPLLSDEDYSLVRAYDIVDPTYPEGNRRHGLPTPTIFFVSPDGHVRARLGDADFRVRPAPETVVATIDGLR